MDGSGMTEWNKACLPCRLVHSTCNGDRPCKRCCALGRPDQCVNVERKKRGRPRKNPIEGEELLEKRARIEELGADGDGAAHNSFHPSFPSIPLQQQAFYSLFPQSQSQSQSPSPSSSPHSSPPSSSSGSSSSPFDLDAPAARSNNSRRHHDRPGHHHPRNQYQRNHQSRDDSRQSTEKRDRGRPGQSQNQSQQAVDVNLLIDEMKELRKENRSLNDKLAYFCEKVDRRLSSSERKIDSLSTTLTTTAAAAAAAGGAQFLSPWSAPTPAFTASPLHIRKEVLKDLPFLLDYDIISEKVPFLIDDLRKPFIVRRIFDPTPEEDLTVPVTTFANPACCALLGTVLHELVGAPCWFALEQPIRAYLTAKSDKAVGDIFLNAITRKGRHKRLLRLFSRNQVFYNAKGHAKWWISIIDKTEELPPAAQLDSNKLALILNRNRRGGATISLVPKDDDQDDDDDLATSPSAAISTSPATISSSSPASSPSPFTSSSSSSSSSSVMTTSFFAPAPTFTSPFLSSSSLAPVASPSFTSLLAGVIGGGPLQRSDGSGAELESGAGRDKPEFLDQELQELWALLAPGERESVSTPLL